MWRIKRILISALIFVILYWLLPLDYICEIRIFIAFASSLIFCGSLHFIFQPYNTIWDLFATYNNESKEFAMKKSEIATVILLIIPFILIFAVRLEIRIDNDINKNRQEVMAIVTNSEKRPGSRRNHYYLMVNYTYKNDDFRQEIEVPWVYYDHRKSNKIVIVISGRNPLFARVKLE